MALGVSPKRLPYIAKSSVQRGSSPTCRVPPLWSPLPQLGCAYTLLSTPADRVSDHQSPAFILPVSARLHLISHQRTHLFPGLCCLISACVPHTCCPSVLSTLPHTVFCGSEGKNEEFLNFIVGVKNKARMPCKRAAGRYAAQPCWPLSPSQNWQTQPGRSSHAPADKPQPTSQTFAVGQCSGPQPLLCLFIFL